MIFGVPWEIAGWTVLVASLCAVMCALVGVWLVLQRASMTGDAISHAVLPGLALTFILFGTRAPLPMMFGAALAGVLTVVLSRAITHGAGVKEDGSLGVVFTVFFALGVILITRYAAQVDLDPGCVLYGLVEFVALDTAPVLGIEMPRVLVNIVPTLLVVVLFLWLARREMALMAFDPALAKALGRRPNALYYGFMSMVALATVASFEAVGSILVVAMLVGPAATAQLLTQRLRPMFVISVVVALLSAALGYLLAGLANTSVAGMMACVVGALYALAVTGTALQARREKPA